MGHEEAGPAPGAEQWANIALGPNIGDQTLGPNIGAKQCILSKEVGVVVRLLLIFRPGWR